MTLAAVAQLKVGVVGAVAAILAGEGRAEVDLDVTQRSCNINANINVTKLILSLIHI